MILWSMKGLITLHALFYLPFLLRTCTLSPDNKGQASLLSKLLRKAEKQSRYMGVTITVPRRLKDDQLDNFGCYWNILCEENASRKVGR
jgi:hypothetical protein